ncbi:MaoC family dehydratase [Streptomyces sp. C6-003]
MLPVFRPRGDAGYEDGGYEDGGYEDGGYEDGGYEDGGYETGGDAGDEARGADAGADGDVLPPLEVPVTRLLIVAGAIASRDYQDVHHDAEAAREKGAPDIFMNILTTGGLVGRYLTDHFGPHAVLRRLAVRLGAPNHPGDTMLLTGSVEEVADGTATVRVVGTNSLGTHVTGTATLTLAAPPADGLYAPDAPDDPDDSDVPDGPDGPHGPDGPDGPHGPDGPEAMPEGARI